MKPNPGDALEASSWLRRERARRVRLLGDAQRLVTEDEELATRGALDSWQEGWVSSHRGGLEAATRELASLQRAVRLGATSSCSPETLREAVELAASRGRSRGAHSLVVVIPAHLLLAGGYVEGSEAVRLRVSTAHADCSLECYDCDGRRLLACVEVLPRDHGLDGVGAHLYRELRASGMEVAAALEISAAALRESGE